MTLRNLLALAAGLAVGGGVAWVLARYMDVDATVLEADAPQVTYQ